MISNTCCGEEGYLSRACPENRTWRGLSRAKETRRTDRKYRGRQMGSRRFFQACSQRWGRGRRCASRGAGESCRTSRGRQWGRHGWGVRSRSKALCWRERKTPNSVSNLGSESSMEDFAADSKSSENRAGSCRSSRGYSVAKMKGFLYWSKVLREVQLED